MVKRYIPILGLVAWAGLVAVQTLPTGAAVIGEPDRNTVAEWAEVKHLDPAQAEARYAATGVVTCNWEEPEWGSRTSISTGQVTALPDLVTLSGHIFIDPFICEEKASPSNCQFTITNNGVVETAMMTEILAIGIDCDSAARPTLGDRLVNDWALVRLDSRMAVAPYQIADGLGEAVAENTKVVSVVHSQDYLVLNPEGGTLHPKTVSECTVRDLLNRAGRLVYFTSDCDGAQRSSGGSVLNDTLETPVLIGIWAAASEDRLLLDEAVERVVAAGQYRDDLANVGEYAINSWSSRHVPVAGAFLMAIREAVETTAN